DEQQWVKGVHADVTRHSVNGHVTGYAIGKTAVRARLYNKSVEMRKAKQEWYPQLLAARNGERFDPALDLWRLEFQLRREGIRGFRLCAKPEMSDPDAVIDAELEAEDLPPSPQRAQGVALGGSSLAVPHQALAAPSGADERPQPGAVAGASDLGVAARGLPKTGATGRTRPSRRRSRAGPRRPLQWVPAAAGSHGGGAA